MGDPIYLVYLEGADNMGIFRRQLTHFRESGLKLVVLYPIVSISRRGVSLVHKRDYEDFFDICIPIPAPSYTQYPGPIWFLFHFIALHFSLIKVRQLVGKIPSVRTRGQVAGSLLACGPYRDRLTVDVRGIVHDEAKLLGRSRWTYGWLNFVEIICYRRARKFTTATRGLEQYLRDRGVRAPIKLLEPRVFESPVTTPGVKRESSVVFLGSLSPWNRIENVFQFLSENDWVKELVFLGSNPPLCDICDKFPKVKFDAYKVPPDRVQQELTEFEFGLVLGSGKNSLTELTMVPSKVYEYCSVGLIPILPNSCSEAIRFCRTRNTKFVTFG